MLAMQNGGVAIDRKKILLKSDVFFLKNQNDFRLTARNMRIADSCHAINGAPEKVDPECCRHFDAVQLLINISDF
ncbi:MAG: hypothetical protein HQL65_14735 [Magnetococcales bacterium]|nr:hypothetical protein [Magnetococcales bacterium]